MSALNPAVHEELKKGSLSFAEQAHYGQKCLQTFALDKLSRTVLKVPQVWREVKVCQISAGLFWLYHGQVS